VEQTFSAILALKKKARIDPGELITAIRLFVEKTGASARLDPRMANSGAFASRGLKSLLGSKPSEMILFELNGVRLKVAQHEEPYVSGRGIHTYINPAMWVHGLGEFTDHRSYVRIFESGVEGENGPDAIFDRAAAVTASLSVLGQLTEPVGVIWEPARNSVPIETFRAGVEGLMEGGAPVELWTRWHLVPPGPKEHLNPGVLTEGLTSFTGREILVRPSTAETRVMVDHAYALARKLIDERPALSDGQTIEGAQGEELRLNLRAEGLQQEAPTNPNPSPVLEVALLNPPPAEPAPPPMPDYSTEAQPGDTFSADEVDPSTLADIDPESARILRLAAGGESSN